MAEEIAARDARDRGRAHSPLRAAADAVVVDTTNRSIDDIIAMLQALVHRHIAELASNG
jgi:cytidylate kinase